MNGAQSLIHSLVDHDLDTCFMNPGTSEMHFVAALDDVPQMRGVLCLFEGVATGAADGYARLADKPAGVLLHLGPGLGNGLANLHNARRAHTPVVNIVGDHALSHARFDAPLQSDIQSVAHNVSGWVRTSSDPRTVAEDGVSAIQASLDNGGQVATLILPADVCWESAGDQIRLPELRRQDQHASSTTVADIAALLSSGEPCVLLAGGKACRSEALKLLSAVANATGAKLLGETFPSRLARGAGEVPLERLIYLAEFAEMQLAGAKHIILVDAKEPAAFFGYPGRDGSLVPDGADVTTLVGPGEHVLAAVRGLAELLGVDESAATLQPLNVPERPTGALTGEAIGASIAATLPENAIVVDEGNTSGIWISGATAGTPRHDWLTLTGGAIGYGMPAALGASIACPDRPVLNLEADGSAMYTLQALWSQAREGANVTTVILNNSSYAVLNMELSKVGAGEAGPRAKEMLDLSGPNLDFVALAEGMGIRATRVESAEELCAALDEAYAADGPHLIDVPTPPLM